MNFTLAKVKLNIIKFFTESFGKMSADTLGWLAAIVLHCATVPTLLALLTGLSDRTPSLDLVLFTWAGLLLLFCRAIILKDKLNIITIGLGFACQATAMAIILFK